MACVLECTMARGDTITAQNRVLDDPLLDWLVGDRQPYPSRSVGCKSVLSPTGSICIEEGWCDYRIWMDWLNLSWMGTWWTYRRGVWKNCERPAAEGAGRSEVEDGR
jgi:hypothetical protein